VRNLDSASHISGNLNWLPAPKDKFIFMLRLYWPDENPSILDGTWKIPQVKAVE
jgi:hypothetical protein